MEEKQKDLKEYINLLKRRKIQVLIPLAVFFLVTLLVAYFWPQAYRSTATILIEEQEVPLDLVRSTVTSYADQRIQTIKHQVMTRANLLRIIEQYGLYQNLRQRRTTEEILKKMVDNINIDVISAEVVDKRTGQQTHATIAFTLSYKGESPQLTQKVASEMTSLFLGENLKARERSAQETSSFLKEEAENLSRRIAVLERKITGVKHQADGALPELIQMNMQLMNQTDQELISLDQEIRSLKERKISLEGELASLKPNSPMVSAAGEKILDSSERLKVLRAQYVSQSSYLSPKHPDLIKMKKEIEALEKETGEKGVSGELYKKLAGEKAQLATLLDRYGKDHPDVIRSQKVTASLEKELSLSKNRGSDSPLAVQPENPAYINVQTQLASTTHTLESLEAAREEMKKRADTYAEKVKMTPMIEQGYLDLNRDRDNSVQKYNEIRSKLLEAKVSEGLEAEHKGERFSLIDPPEFPERPESPNRPVILLLGFFLATVGGFGCGAVAESLDHSIRTPEALGLVTRVSPLAAIPYIPNGEDERRKKARRKALIWGGSVMVLTSIVLIHFFWYPLDILWFVILRKAGIE
ncbi:MAG: GumC family protein [Nitrospiria bacterium]